ncbi:Rrf2 family transcriptional regulator [uncultured Alsobacter sp.]|uniref:RrF2 family transcriptional regulator n=1 Tax=uncultured Alsobacter sp. TaxID=1748258 RepID=UPI0025DFEE6C|nr:Rrf2 family transcriptional regulator [uncultured Alsobacter sp.]
MLTMKGKYGLKAMVHLAGAEPGRPVLVNDIAERNAIPRKFLDAILADLRNAGFVQSKKGKGGGFTLAHPPAQIRIGHVIRVLDGPLAPLPCASKTAYRRCQDCTDERQCAVRLMMIEVRNAISTVLDGRTLAEMRAMADLDEMAAMYHI